MQLDYRILFIILIFLCIYYADSCSIDFHNWNVLECNWNNFAWFFSAFTMKTKTRSWRHIYHNIEISRPRNYDIIKIASLKNRDIEIDGLKHHGIEKQRQLSHDIVMPMHFFRVQKATTSGSQDWKTATSRFQD